MGKYSFGSSDFKNVDAAIAAERVRAANAAAMDGERMRGGAPDARIADPDRMPEWSLAQTNHFANVKRRMQAAVNAESAPSVAQREASARWNSVRALGDTLGAQREVERKAGVDANLAAERAQRMREMSVTNDGAQRLEQVRGQGAANVASITSDAQRAVAQTQGTAQERVADVTGKWNAASTAKTAEAAYNQAVLGAQKEMAVAETNAGAQKEMARLNSEATQKTAQASMVKDSKTQFYNSMKQLDAVTSGKVDAKTLQMLSLGKTTHEIKSLKKALATGGNEEMAKVLYSQMKDTPAYSFWAEANPDKAMAMEKKYGSLGDNLGTDESNDADNDVTII